MDHAWIDRRTSQPDNDKACQRSHFSKGQNHDQNSRCDNSLSQTDHLDIIELHGNKSADSTSSSNAYVEQAGKFRCQFHRNMLIQSQIAAGPQPGGGFQSTVAEETEHHFPGARQGKHLPQAQCLRGGFFGAALRATLLPQGQADHQHHGEQDLEQGNGPVADRPVHSMGQRRAHDHGAHHGADAPHAVQPAHMAASVVQGNVVVQGCVHAAGTQPVGDGPQAEHPELCGDGKPEQRCGGHAHADGRDPAGAEGPGQPVALQAGKDRAQRDDHGKDTRAGHRDPQLRVHGGPGRPQQGIRQAQTDKSSVNDGQKKRDHRLEFLPQACYTCNASCALLLS